MIDNISYGAMSLEERLTKLKEFLGDADSIAHRLYLDYDAQCMRARSGEGFPYARPDNEVSRPLRTRADIFLMISTHLQESEELLSAEMYHDYPGIFPTE